MAKAILYNDLFDFYDHDEAETQCFFLPMNTEQLEPYFVDYKPVIHAHWEEHVHSGGKLFFKCSNCGHWFTPVHGHIYNYCFCCGAKMDEEVE